MTESELTFEQEILIPHIVYQKNPIKAIKSKLGNDITIVSYTVSDMMTTNEEFLVKVVYTAVDFSPFEIYKVSDVKRVNTNSDKYIGKTENGVCVKLNSNVKEAFVKLNTLTQSNTTDNIVYYGDIITSPQDIMTNFCSAFCTIKLSYHGTAITSSIPKDVKLKDVLKSKSDTPDEGILNKKVFDDFQSMSHDYSRNYFDISYLKQQISNKITVLKTEDIVKTPGIYSAENLSLNELNEVLKKTKTGIFFMLSGRSNPYIFIYLPNHEMSIKPHLIEHMLIVMAKDIENINKFEKGL